MGERPDPDPTTPRRKSKVATGRRRRAADLGAAADPQTRIAEAAYFLAEKRGFERGHELDDWLAAEGEVMRLTRKRQ